MTAWLIEHAVPGKLTRYFVLDRQPAWDKSNPLKPLLCNFPKDALRFSREQDARLVLQYLIERRNLLVHPAHEYRVCEHQFEEAEADG